MIIRITTIPTWLPSESSSLGWVFSTKRGEPFTASAFGPFLASRENFHQVLERQGSGERGQHSLGPPLVELTKDSTVQARRSWRASLLTQVPWLGAIIGGICRITLGSPSQRTKTKRAPVEPLARADSEGDQAGRPRRASVAFAQDDRVKCSCDAAGHREPGSRPGRIARGHCNRRLSRNQPKLGVLGFGRRDRAPHRSTESWPCSCLNRAHRRSPIDKYQQDDRFLVYDGLLCITVSLFGRRRVDDDRNSSGQSGSDRQNSHAPGARDWDSLPGTKATTLEKLSMKLIIALVQPTKLEAVKEALSRVEVFRLTVMDVQGFGRQKGYTEVYRGHEVTVNLLRKIELQIAVNEDFVEPTVNAILEAGRSGPDGKIGDGKIFILPLDDCIRIRTGERGPEAI